MRVSANLLTWSLALAMGIGCLGMTACGESESAQETVDPIEEEIPAATRTSIDLPSNPSTGYSWTYRMEPEGVLVETENVYNEPTTSAEGTVGAPGRQVFTFEAGHDGSVTIEMRYARSWEDAEPDSTVTYTFEVKDGVIEPTGFDPHMSEALVSMGSQSTGTQSDAADAADASGASDASDAADDASGTSDATSSGSASAGSASGTADQDASK